MARTLCALQVHAIHQAQQVGHIILANDDVRLVLGLYHPPNEVTAALRVGDEVIACSKALDSISDLTDKGLSVFNRLAMPQFAPVVGVHGFPRLEVDQVADVIAGRDDQFSSYGRWARVIDLEGADDSGALVSGITRPCQEAWQWPGVQPWHTRSARHVDYR